MPYYTAAISAHDPFVDLSAIDVHYAPDQEPSKQVILSPSQPATPRLSPEATRSLYERTQNTLSDLPFYAAITLLLPLGATFFLLNSGVQTFRSAQRVRLHEQGQSGISIGRYRVPLLLEEAQHAVQDGVFQTLSHGNEQYLPTPPPEPACPEEQVAKSTASSASSSSTAVDRSEDKEDSSPFPTLALTPEQFAMIDNLNAVGLTKYAAHIRNVRHTHAAIVVRSERESFWEGRVVSSHWAGRFEV